MGSTASRPYDKMQADLNGVSRGRRIIAPADADMALTAKAIEVVNKGATVATVAITDGMGNTSVVTVLAGAKDYVPCLVTRVAATGTTVSVDVIIHGYFDAE